jgi:hypothetical protein
MVDAEEYVSIQLSSSEDTIGVLLKKAMFATQTKPFVKNDKKIGVL